MAAAGEAARGEGCAGACACTCTCTCTFPVSDWAIGDECWCCWAQTGDEKQIRDAASTALLSVFMARKPFSSRSIGGIGIGRSGASCVEAAERGAIAQHDAAGGRQPDAGV